MNGTGSKISFASSTSSNNLTIAGGNNTISDFAGTVNAANSVGNTFIDATGTLYTGAYSSFVDANGATIVTGAKSQLLQCSNTTITTGSDSVFDTFNNGTINAGIKTIANVISNSDVTLGRNSSIVTLTNSNLTTDGTGTTVGALKNSLVNWSTDGNGDFASGGYGSFTLPVQFRALTIFKVNPFMPLWQYGFYRTTETRYMGSGFHHYGRRRKSVSHPTGHRRTDLHQCRE